MEKNKKKEIVKKKLNKKAVSNNNIISSIHCEEMYRHIHQSLRDKCISFQENNTIADVLNSNEFKNAISILTNIVKSESRDVIIWRNKIKVTKDKLSKKWEKQLDYLASGLYSGKTSFEYNRCNKNKTIPPKYIPFFSYDEFVVILCENKYYINKSRVNYIIFYNKLNNCESNEFKFLCQ